MIYTTGFLRFFFVKLLSLLLQYFVLSFLVFVICFLILRSSLDVVAIFCIVCNELYDRRM